MFNERESGDMLAVKDFWPVRERNTVSKAIFLISTLLKTDADELGKWLRRF